LETCLRDAAAIGYGGVELGRKFPREAAELAPLLAAHGLELASGWYSGFLAKRGASAEIDAVRPFATLLQAMGCAVMVYGECGMMVPDAPLDAPMSRHLRMPAEEVAGYAARLSAATIRALRRCATASPRARPDRSSRS
jgi:inosose dehydratase